jgi:hypothetical protein
MSSRADRRATREMLAESEAGQPGAIQKRRTAQFSGPVGAAFYNEAGNVVKDTSMPFIFKEPEKRQVVEEIQVRDPNFGLCSVPCRSLKADFGRMSLNEIETFLKETQYRASNVPLDKLQENDTETKNKLSNDLAVIDCANKWVLQCEEELAACGKNCDELANQFQSGSDVPLPKEARTNLFDKFVNDMNNSSVPRDSSIAALTNMKCLLDYESCLSRQSEITKLNPNLHTPAKKKYVTPRPEGTKYEIVEDEQTRRMRL